MEIVRELIARNMIRLTRGKKDSSRDVFLRNADAPVCLIYNYSRCFICLRLMFAGFGVGFCRLVFAGAIIPEGAATLERFSF